MRFSRLSLTTHVVAASEAVAAGAREAYRMTLAFRFDEPDVGSDVAG
jgi:hypothetical protein